MKAATGTPRCRRRPSLRRRWPSPGRRGRSPENFVPPLLDYAHQEMPFLRGCVIGGYVYRGAAIPALRGHYVFGDFTNARIYSIVTTPGGGTPAGLPTGRGN